MIIKTIILLIIIILIVISSYIIIKANDNDYDDEKNGQNKDKKYLKILKNKVYVHNYS